MALAAWALLLAACDAAEPPAQTASGQPAAAAAAAQAPAAAPALDFPTLTGRVVDQADLLSPEEEARLTEELAALERRTTDQLVIVTMASLAGRSIEDFARALGNHWRIGQAEKDNGVLLVVAPEERRVRIEVGYGLEPILTDERAKAILDRDVLPAFRDDRYPDGISAGARAIIAMLIAHETEPRRGRP